ncbi:MAG: hypothetical protein ACOYEA_07350 [Fermentimonas sp.]|jgi:hypothetical protein
MNKLYRYFAFILILSLSISNVSCKDNQLKYEPNSLENEKESKEKDSVKQTLPNQEKMFSIYDAISYPGKPSLYEEGLLPIMLFYEASLTNPSSSNSNKSTLNIEKLNRMAKLANTYPGVMISTDVESWFSLNESEQFVSFSSLFDAFRKENPDVVIGNYGIATSSLCVKRFYESDKFSDYEIVSRWRDLNEPRWKILKELSDVAMPVAYISEPNITSWIRDLKITVDEIKKHSDKRVLLFIWPQYYDKPDSPYNKKFIDPVIWTQMLEACFQYTDGVIIWSSTKDEKNNLVYWNRPEVQDIWIATKTFIERHSDNINRVESEIFPDVKLNTPVKKFKMFASLSYANTPDLLNKGIHQMRVVNEKELSNGSLTNNIYEPLIEKVENLASQMSATPNVPVLIMGGTWIRDRNNDNASMINRYKKVFETFKNKSTNNLAFFNVGPSSLSGLRVNNSNYFISLSSWKNNIESLVQLNNIPDIIAPATYIIDDDVDMWKRDFVVTIEEARRNSGSKPVYAQIYTDYFNNENNFGNAYKPIKEETFKAMLDVIFNTCDGVIITNLTNRIWDEQYGFWKALNKFIEEHKENIDFPASY